MTNLYSISVFSILIFLLITLYEKKIFPKNDNLKITKLTFKINPLFYYMILLFYVLFTQSQYLNYETIDWDTNSYLVSSQDILRGNLPYENQWESKQALFYYIYAFLIFVSNGNLIIFKFLNDFLLYVLSIILFLILKVFTNDIKIYHKILQMRNLDFSEKRFIHENLYWNYRLSSLQAALGVSQLKNLNKVIEKKVSQGNYYINKLKKYNEIIKLPINKKDQINHFWVFGILLIKDNIRDIVTEDLKNNGIETRPFFWPLHLQPALPKKFNNNSSLPVSENLGKNGFYIPIGSHIKKSDQDKIADCLIESVMSNS